MSATGIIFNVQKYAVQDGPGIRTTVFLKGCPLHCFWCHNPESRSPAAEVVTLENRCLVCGQCREDCPIHSSAEAPLPPPGQNPECTLCAACVESCSTGARQMIGRIVTIEEVMRQLVQDRVFYEESGGGITVSGGEPLLQADFLFALLAACRDAELHTAVDTSGYAPWPDLLKVVPVTDLFLYDVKLIDDATHRRYTGVSSEPILNNLQTLGRHHANIWVRIPVIPGLTDAPDQMEALASFVAPLPGITQVHLLPYHGTGVQKHRRLGHRDQGQAETLAPPTNDSLDQCLRVLLAHGLNARVGG